MITIQKASKQSGENFKRRVNNIIFFASLDRDGLQYQANEKQLEIFIIGNEKISIIYPGKESNGWNKWDFRPILQIQGNEIPNLSFGDIWKAIDYFLNNIPDIEKREATILLARIFYKVAFFQVHTKRSNEFFADAEIAKLKNSLYIFDKTQLSNDEQTLFNYNIQINNKSISLESFIIYNDLLCSNEDSKYFYRTYIEERAETEAEKTLRESRGERKKKLYRLKTKDKSPLDILSFNAEEDSIRNINWQGNIGRINTFLTHINVLKFIYDEQDPYDLLADSAIKRGVFHIKNDEDLINFLNQNIGEA